jgi:hypothetical protein
VGDAYTLIVVARDHLILSYIIFLAAGDGNMAAFVMFLNHNWFIYFI